MFLVRNESGTAYIHTYIHTYTYIHIHTLQISINLTSNMSTVVHVQRVDHLQTVYTVDGRSFFCQTVEH